MRPTYYYFFGAVSNYLCDNYEVGLRNLKIYLKSKINYKISRYCKMGIYKSTTKCENFFSIKVTNILNKRTKT